MAITPEEAQKAYETGRASVDTGGSNPHGSDLGDLCWAVATAGLSLILRNPDQDKKRKEWDKGRKDEEKKRKGEN